jgi:hypothetical protein
LWYNCVFIYKLLWRTTYTSMNFPHF